MAEGVDFIQIDSNDEDDQQEELVVIDETGSEDEIELNASRSQSPFSGDGEIVLDEINSSVENSNECKCENCGYKTQLESLQKEVISLRAKLELLEPKQNCKKMRLDGDQLSAAESAKTKLASKASSRTIRRERSRAKRNAILARKNPPSNSTNDIAVEGKSDDPGTTAVETPTADTPKVQPQVFPKQC